jgi:hypothetical protein
MAMSSLAWDGSLFYRPWIAESIARAYRAAMVRTRLRVRLFFVQMS